MNTTIEKKLDYRCFLLGIILYWMFDAVWGSFASFFFALEAVLHPIAIVVGKSLLFLLVFYLLFRKPRMIDVKWGHLAMLVGFILLMTALDYFLLDRFFDLHSVADNRMECDITMSTMRNVRKWANLAVSLLFIGFLWWHYDSENTEADPTIWVSSCLNTARLTQSPPKTGCYSTMSPIAVIGCCFWWPLSSAAGN